MRRLGALAVAAGLSLLVIDGPASAAEFKSTEARKAVTDYDTAVRAAKNGFLQGLAKARQAGERRKAATPEAEEMP